MTDTRAHWYSSDRTQQELSNECHIMGLRSLSTILYYCDLDKSTLSIERASGLSRELSYMNGLKPKPFSLKSHGYSRQFVPLV